MSGFHKLCLRIQSIAGCPNALRRFLLNIGGGKDGKEYSDT